MIGIQLHGSGGTVAAWTESGPEVFGTAETLEELVAIVQAREGIRLEDGTCIGVPAWSNDAQRQEIKDTATQAGIVALRLINEPTAIAIDYSLTQDSTPEMLLILNVTGAQVFDVTLISHEDGHFTVLAAKGLQKLTLNGSSADFSAIEPVIRSALRDAGLKQAPACMVLAGNTPPLLAIADRLEAAFGIAPQSTTNPLHAIARGAAAFGFLYPIPQQGPASTQTQPQAKAGCLSLLALALLPASLLIYLS